MKLLFIIAVLFLSNSAQADLKNSFLEISGGLPVDLVITNPDDSKAYYDGAAFKTQFHYNFSGSRNDTAYGITVHYKYLNLDNTKSGGVKESASHKMFGVGFFAKFSGFFVGTNYSFANAKHQSTGTIDALDEFKYNPLSVEVSYTIPYGNLLEVGPGYSYTMADLANDETGLSKDVPYKEQVFWLKLLFYFK